MSVDVNEREDDVLSYNKKLVRIMSEHSLLVPGEEDMMASYLFCTG